MIKRGANHAGCLVSILFAGPPSQGAVSGTGQALQGDTIPDYAGRVTDVKKYPREQSQRPPLKVVIICLFRGIDVQSRILMLKRAKDTNHARFMQTFKTAGSVLSG